MNHIKKALILFLASYISVFLMGFMNLVSVNYHFFLAWWVSLGIGTCQLFILKQVPHQLSKLELAGYLMGGPFGMISGMFMYKYFF